MNSFTKVVGTGLAGGGALLASADANAQETKLPKANHGETVKEVRLDAKQLKELKGITPDLTRIATNIKADRFSATELAKKPKVTTEPVKKKVSWSRTRPNERALNAEELEQRETIYQEYGHVIPRDMKEDFIKRADQQISNGELRNFLYGISILNNAEENPSVGKPGEIITAQEVRSLMSHADLDTAGDIVYTVAKAAKYGFEGKPSPNSELRYNLLAYMQEYKVAALPQQKTFASIK